MKIVLLIVSIYLLINATIILVNLKELDKLYNVSIKRLGYDVPEFVMYGMLLFAGVFVIGFKKFGAGFDSALEEAVSEKLNEEKYSKGDFKHGF